MAPEHQRTLPEHHEAMLDRLMGTASPPAARPGELSHLTGRSPRSFTISADPSQASSWDLPLESLERLRALARSKGLTMAELAEQILAGAPDVPRPIKPEPGRWNPGTTPPAGTVPSALAMSILASLPRPADTSRRLDLSAAAFRRMGIGR